MPTIPIARKASGLHPVEYFVLFLLVVAVAFVLTR
jgi:hypothetical protein